MLADSVGRWQDFYYAVAVKFDWRNPFCLFGLVLLWRVVLLVLTAQPIPANDAFGYDGAVVNWLRHGAYINPPLAEVFPISGTQIYAHNPPGYQLPLLLWMRVFGTSVISSMALHLALLAAAGGLVLGIVKTFFPAAANYAPVALLFFGFTFGDRPEDLAHIFGLAALWLVARQIEAGRPNLKAAAGIALLLWLTLYTTLIVGLFYLGIGFLASVVAWWSRRREIFILSAPFPAALALFAVATAAIMKFEPLWWQGFLENAREQSALKSGLHRPGLFDVFKLIRIAPVFLLALAAVPLVCRRRREWPAGAAWWALVCGVLVTGLGLLAADLMLISPNYASFVMFAQILLAAGWLAVAENLFPAARRWCRAAIFAGALLVSVRAVGMTTWGAVCAWKNSYAQTHATLRTELMPFTATNSPVVVSSAFLYSAREFGVRRPIHADWYFDHAVWTNDAEVNALIRLQPAKLVLTQFDYYRSFAPVLERLRGKAGTVKITVRDQAAVKPPDAIPSLQRVVQHISWAPVVVDLDWPATQ